MSGKAIATVGSMHVCPMCTGTVPHVGGPVSGPGATGVTISGKPVALMGDMCVCVGSPDMIVQGDPGVSINGVPVATINSMTAHGGMITSGEVGVTISPNTEAPAALVTMHIQEIPFPEISIVNKALAVFTGNSNKEAESNQEQIKEEAKKHGYLSDFSFSQ
ncbi:PAAR domain-containing protein [Aquimarina sp. RZ0]|uniref:PAAR domain-containing protein n=1 Tax=Aquimarina sp. RZ0 TaxID=2607730 RepID=UPI0011F18E82|nr:PAAR domain-containing protein [Aquimarina sp. RZ0]KAA1244507.1 paar repeat-containing protein [Aquimarina sp. RZ0]